MPDLTEWIDADNEDQHRWARSYLNKKKVGATNSDVGKRTACSWDGLMPPARFLLGLVEKTLDDDAKGLLNLMRKCWAQEVGEYEKKSELKRRTYPMKPRTHSRLKKLAKLNRLTIPATLELLITEQYKVLVAESEKEQQEKRKLRATISALRDELKEKTESLKRANESLQNKIDERSAIKSTLANEKHELEKSSPTFDILDPKTTYRRKRRTIKNCKTI